jgi:hypothetical protein
MTTGVEVTRKAAAAFACTIKDELELIIAAKVLGNSSRMGDRLRTRELWDGRQLLRRRAKNCSIVRVKDGLRA